MSEYRTSEQYQEIVENMINGNWSDAARQCVEYGFYANDLHNAYIEEVNENVTSVIDDVWDFVELAEMAEKLRANE